MTYALIGLTFALTLLIFATLGALVYSRIRNLEMKVACERELNAVNAETIGLTIDVVNKGAARLEAVEIILQKILEDAYGIKPKASRDVPRELLN